MTGRTEELQDEILVLEYRSGDVEALGTLVSRWQTRIYCYIHLMVQDHSAAWDVSQ